MTDPKPAPPAAPNDERWSVCRVDDNGNRFVVRRDLNRVEAERLAAEFEARGHKQTYWVEPQAH